MTSRVLQFPSVQLRSVVEETVAGVTVSAYGATSAVIATINRQPEPDEEGVPLAPARVIFQLHAEVAPNFIDLIEHRAWVNGEFAYGTSGQGFTGVGSPYVGAGFTLEQELIDSKTLQLTLTRAVPFESNELVEVAVFANMTEVARWSFTTADTKAPTLVDVVGQAPNTVRVTFDEAMGDSALEPSAYQLAGVSTFAVDVAAVSVERVDASTVDVTFDVPLTFGASYRLQVGAVEDDKGNALAPLGIDDQIVFSAYNPEVPEGRRFVLWDFIPEANKRADKTRDLLKFVTCLQEVTNLLLYEIDRFATIIDPDVAPEQFVDAMLADLGNPFSMVDMMSLADKRRLLGVLITIYQLKGTTVGLQAVARFFFGIELEVHPLNVDGWVLGVSELGVDTVLGPNRDWHLYAFTVTTSRALTDEERTRLIEIIEYMKPAHTHLVRVIEPTGAHAPVFIDHVSLGFSNLGENFILH